MGKLKVKGIKITGYISMDVTTLTAIGGQNDTGAATFFGQTAKHFGIDQGYVGDDVRFDIFGKGFKYQGEFGIPTEVPTSGTVKKVEVSVGGSLALVVEKLNLPALKAIDLYLKDDPFAAFEKLLKGNDTIIGSEESDNLWSGKGNDLLWGRGSNDILDGFKGDDINDGGIGNDYLIDTKGNDWFQFSTELSLTAALNLNFNYDTIKKFAKGDEIYLKTSVFDSIGAKLDKGEFVEGPAPLDANDYIIWNSLTRIAYYDADGVGSEYDSIPFFTTENNAVFNYKSFVMGAMYDTGY